MLKPSIRDVASVLFVLQHAVPSHRAMGVYTLQMPAADWTWLQNRPPAFRTAYLDNLRQSLQALLQQRRGVATDPIELQWGPGDGWLCTVRPMTTPDIVTTSAVPQHSCHLLLFQQPFDLPAREVFWDDDTPPPAPPIAWERSFHGGIDAFMQALRALPTTTRRWQPGHTIYLHGKNAVTYVYVEEDI